MKTLELYFLSDWQIGEGSGQPGHINKLVRRHPQDRLPYVPAKTITGIWRDACEQVAVGLDDGQEKGPWQAWVTTLFGTQPGLNENAPDISPQSACLTVRPARLPQSLRQQLANSPPLKEALTFIKPTVRIDRQTGQAVNEHLFFNEVVRAGAVLETQVSIDETFTETQEKTAYALLWAGAKAVERLGGKRRRGVGRCQLKFHAISKVDALKILKQTSVPPCPKPSIDDKTRFNLISDHKPSDAWVQVPLHLTLKSPVIVPQREVGNMIKSLDYISGTLLLSPVTRLLRKSTQLDLFNEVVKGNIQVSHAYLEVMKTRGLPVPLALVYDNQGRVWNRLVENAEHPHREGYISTFEKTLPTLSTTSLQVTTHGTIEDTSQRSAEMHGSVFSFEAINAGTRLQSVLKLRQSVAQKLQAANKAWWKVLNTNIHVGKSKKDDYGWVQLQANTCEPIPTPPISSDKLVVWLCSDLLLRDARLRPSIEVTDLQKELENQLGVKLSLRQSDTLSTLMRTARKDGWHQEWGQPRPSYIGLAAGSCVVFECGCLEQDKLHALMQRGLGERRAEGFGEVRLNPPLLMQKLSTLPRSEISPTPIVSKPITASLPTGTDEFVEILETAAWREDIRRAAFALSIDGGIRRQTFSWSADKPPNNQLGALRTVLTRMQTTADKRHVQDWLNHLRKTDNRKDKWSNKALETIQSLIEQPNLIWEILQNKTKSFKHQFPTLRVDAKAKLEYALWAEAVRTLFALAMHYERKEREG